jgi:hypothetical protein
MKTNWNKGFFLVTLFLLSGCFGSNNDTFEDHPLEDDPTQPFVEVVIEYPGPRDQWAGPQTFSVRVTTLKEGPAQIEVVPSLSGSTSHPVGRHSHSAHALSVEAVREEFARLNHAMLVQEASFLGCLLPVHVKLTRADGAIMERRGCRSQGGWIRVASEVTHHFVELAINSHRTHHE